MRRNLRPTVNMTRWALLFKRWILVALLVPGLAACDRAPTAAELEDLAIEVPDLMSAHPESRDVPPAQWSRALRTLKPKRVYTNAQGLYIVTGSSFVREQGLYVPRDTGTANTDPSHDPSYQYRGLGFYAYRIEG